MTNSLALDVCPFSSSYQQVDKYSAVDGTFYNIFTLHGMLRIIICNLQTKILDVPNIIIAGIYYLTYLIPRHNMTSKLFLISGMAHDGITRQMQI